MTSHPEALYRGVSHAAWGYLFLYLDVNLGTVSILPAFVGYLLFWSAISALEGEVRDLSLLRPLCALLGAWAGAGWLYSWTGGSLDGCFYPLDVILQAASLYFHFQLFTDLALLAEEYGLPSEGLRGCRNVDATISVLILLPLPWEDNELLTVLSILLLLTGIIVRLILVWQLFALRKSFRPEEPEA